MNLVEIGENTDSEYDREHACQENEFPECDRVIHCVSNQDEEADVWQLHCIHYADEEEVKMGEADYVDEVTYHSMILINYCPFCGTKLNAGEDSNRAGQ
jgi:hypothetical protein